MEENPTEISTRVVLTEKVPFLIDIVYDGNYSHGRFLVRPYSCRDDLRYLNSDGIRSRIHNADVINFYIICEGKDKGTIVHKTNCKRVKR